MTDETIFQQVQQSVREVLADLIAHSDVYIAINVSAVARAAYQSCVEDARVPLRIEWTSVEQFKQVARAELRGRFDPNSKSNEVYQGDMFTGHLQAFYPVRTERDADPIYKLREMLTDDEIDQNLAALKKQADARLRHYDALQSFKESRRQAPASKPHESRGQEAHAAGQ